MTNICTFQDFLMDKRVLSTVFVMLIVTILLSLCQLNQTLRTTEDSLRKAEIDADVSKKGEARLMEQLVSRLLLTCIQSPSAHLHSVTFCSLALSYLLLTCTRL